MVRLHSELANEPLDQVVTFVGWPCCFRALCRAHCSVGVQTSTGTGAWAREAFGPVLVAADASPLQAAGSAPLAAPRPEPVPARDYAWCGATRVNVPQLIGGAEVDVTLQVRILCWERLDGCARCGVSTTAGSVRS